MGFFDRKTTRTVEVKVWKPVKKKFNVKTAKVKINFIGGKTKIAIISGYASDAYVIGYDPETQCKSDPNFATVDQVRLTKENVKHLHTLDGSGFNIDNATTWELVKNSIEDLEIEYIDYERVTETKSITKVWKD